ncbi:MAG: hypothetical protein LBK07_09660 [Tannerella sp.]|nr:hypothetical protein [Tannerella sp.]
MKDNPELMNFILDNEEGAVRPAALYGKCRALAAQKLYRVYEAIDLKTLQEKYSIAGRRLEMNKSFRADSDGNTWVITCEIAFDDIRIVTDTCIREDYSLLSYSYFAEEGNDPFLEDELGERALRTKTYDDFLTSGEAEIASCLQRRMDAALARLADA